MAALQQTATAIKLKCPRKMKGRCTWMQQRMPLIMFRIVGCEGPFLFSAKILVIIFNFPQICKARRDFFFTYLFPLKDEDVCLEMRLAETENEKKN